MLRLVIIVCPVWFTLDITVSSDYILMIASVIRDWFSCSMLHIGQSSKVKEGIVNTEDEEAYSYVRDGFKKETF